VGGTNGTLVNGRPITRPTALRDGDVIQIGSSELKACLDREMKRV